MAYLFGWLAGWLAGWLVGWLICMQDAHTYMLKMCLGYIVPAGIHQAGRKPHWPHPLMIAGIAVHCERPMGSDYFGVMYRTNLMLLAGCSRGISVLCQESGSLSLGRATVILDLIGFPKLDERVR